MTRPVVLIALAAVTAAPLLAQDSGRTRTYYVAADEVLWDYAPTGMDQINGIPMDSARRGMRDPGRIGKVYKKAIYREYTDGSFSTLKPRPPAWEHLGQLGPVLRGVVGDTIVVVFRNAASRPYSMHPHGVFYNKDSEGTPYRDGTEGADRADDAVPPGGTHTYVWVVSEQAGPGPHDPSSIMWMYHSHVDEGKDINAGLMGAILVTAAGHANPDGSPEDVDREFVVNFAVMQEGFSWYLRDNIRRTMPLANADSIAQASPEPGNFFDAMNGFVWGNLPGLTVEQGDRVRWYVMASTNEFDFHTPHWHGNTVLAHNTRMDIVSVEPMMMVTADMVAHNPGIWFFHCHVKIHLEGGMAARYTVLPKADLVARAKLEEASRMLEAPRDPFLAGGAKLPGNWKARADRKDTRPDQLRFFPMGDGYHVTLGPAAIFYDPSRPVTGSYRLAATFTQTRPTEHPEAYGLLLGGDDLDGPRQSYLYFLIRQDGRFLVKHREGAETHTLVDWLENAAVKMPDAEGRATNALQVEVGAKKVRFLVNGTEVAVLPRSDRFQTDGVVGLRANHRLDLHIAGFGAEPLPVKTAGN